MEDTKDPLQFMFPVFPKVIYPAGNLRIEVFSNSVYITIGPSVKIRFAYLVNNLLLVLLANRTIKP